MNEDGTPLRAEQNDRRFFEAAWMHKFQGKYYLSYSTGDTRNLVYATGDSPLGPFTYRGVLLRPVIGWTTHHSIVQFERLLVPLLPRCIPLGRTDRTAMREVREARDELRRKHQDRISLRIRRADQAHSHTGSAQELLAEAFFG